MSNLREIDENKKELRLKGEIFFKIIQLILNFFTHNRPYGDKAVQNPVFYFKWKNKTMFKSKTNSRSLAHLGLNTIKLIESEGLTKTENIENFANNASWALPHLMALISSWPIRQNEKSLYSFKNTLKAIQTATVEGQLTYDNGTVLTKDDIVGILSVLRTNPRGSILGILVQSKESGIRWSAGVPLFLSAFKEYKGIDYSRWDFSELEKKFFLNKDMVDYSEYFGNQEPIYDEEILLGFRETALTIKSGTKVGTLRNPTSTTAVYGVTDPVFRKLPTLLKLSLTQLWVFAPSIAKHPLIISNIYDIDKPAKPLVSSEVVSVHGVVDDIPWDL